MSRQYTFACPLPFGVHARPAGAIEELARRFASSIAIENCRTSVAANAKSVLGIVSLDIRAGDLCQVTISGDDEDEAVDSIAAFLDEILPHCDDALPTVVAVAGVELPRALAEAAPELLEGTPVVPGIGEGVAVEVGAFAVPPSIPLEHPPDRRAELTRTNRALDRLTARLDARLGRAAAGIEADLLRAHRSVARDPEFARHLSDAILDRDLTGAGAIASAEHTFTAMLAATGSVILRERALDIRDVCVQLLRELYGPAVGGDDTVLDADSVCLADVMTPGQFLALDPARLKGLVLSHGGTTSHTVILARSRGVPTLVGAAGAERSGLGGRPVVVDADLGVLVTRVTPPVRRYYDLERARIEGRRRRHRFFAGRPAVTADGRRIQIAANIATAAEAGPAFEAGAEAIGLFRTEMLFVDRDSAPGEDEQFEVYRQVVIAAEGRPVIIRTLDVGGDKPLRYVTLPREANPFLGHRAIRIYPQCEPLFREQVRALLRTSACGPLRVMVPMISRVEEARWIRSVVAEERARLGERGIAFDPSMPLGAMIEVPSAAFLVDRLSRELDFFSIGTNDLLQYFTAVDRSSAQVGHLYAPASPAFLRLLAKIVADAHAEGRWVGLCGEMGGEARYLPLLVGLGLDEISMAAPLVPAVKAELSGLTTAGAARLLEAAMNADSSADVERILERALPAAAAPLITPDLVAANGRARTKAEAIKEAVDILYAAGRTERPLDVEEIVWRREAVNSTGFGHGFAIPHARTDAVRADSLVVLKLSPPVEWGSLDGVPAGVVMLLVVRESDEAAAHVQVLPTLARRLMREEFRQTIERETSPEALCELVRTATRTAGSPPATT